MATTQRAGEPARPPISTDESVAGGLLNREDLLERLDWAATKRVTVISAAPGSGKTSLLRAWAHRSTIDRRVAFVSVEREQQDAQRFWSVVLDAIDGPTSSVGRHAQPAASAALDADELVDRVLSALAGRIGPVVLIIDDLHELRSADALEQFDRVLAGVAHLALGDRSAAAAATEAALATAEPDRLIFPFAMTATPELLDALPRHETTHGGLLVEIVDLLQRERASSLDPTHPSQSEELSRSELHVLRYLPTNLTRPQIAGELYLSIHTVNTHIRNIYAKLGARDRSSAVSRARELRLLSSGRS